MKRLAVAILLCNLLGCSSSRQGLVKPLAPGLDDTNTYRKITEVRMVGCQEVKENRFSRIVSVVETTAAGIRFMLDGCYGDKGEVFQIIK